MILGLRVRKKSPFLMSEGNSPSVGPQDTSPQFPQELHCQVPGLGRLHCGSDCVWWGKEGHSNSDIHLSPTFPAQPEVGFAHLLCTQCSGSREAVHSIQHSGIPGNATLCQGHFQSISSNGDTYREEKRKPGCNSSQQTSNSCALLVLFHVSNTFTYIF